jgi:ribosomal protein S27AE
MEEMIEKEKEFVDIEWVNDKNTYNLQTGGLNYGILCDESKNKISVSVSEAHKKGKYNNYENRKGIDPWNKGKTNIYNEDTLQKMSEAKKGKPSWNKGKTGSIPWNKGKKVGPNSSETNEKISNALKERYKNQDHHLKGRESPHKGKKTGKPSWNSGLVLEKNIECPHCGVIGAHLGNMKRWHFDNCKHKT